MGKKCVIDDVAVGIITENDHKLGLCLCSKCTCGEHVCASKYLFNAQTMKLKSTYESQYTKFPVVSNPQSIRHVSPVSSVKFSGLSTYKLDFIKHDSTPNPRFSKTYNKPAIAGMLRSSYAKDFVAFNAVRQESLSPIVFKTGKCFKFDGETTYRNNFVNTDKGGAAKSFGKIAKKIFIDPNSYLETSNKRDYKGMNKMEVGVSSVVESGGNEIIGVVGMSSNKRDFGQPDNSFRNLPRRLAAIRELMNK